MTHLVILGAAGDLASRYLMPALAELHAAGVLPGGLTITGVDRQPWDDVTFRRHLASRVDAMPFGSELRYRRGDVTDIAALREALGSPEIPAVVYLALPHRSSPEPCRPLPPSRSRPAAGS